jgi:hypothetical protein
MTQPGPSWTDELTAWSTLGGAVGTVASVLVIGFGLLREVRLRRREDDDRKAAYARRVTVEFQMEAEGVLIITIVNDSDGPLRNVSCLACVFGRTFRECYGLEPHRVSNYVPAHDRLRDEYRPGEPLPDVVTFENIDITAKFTDVQGLRWEIESRSDRLYRLIGDERIRVS